jgi:parvulin-like peptidyl-prolyl isomerase
MVYVLLMIVLGLQIKGMLSGSSVADDSAGSPAAPSAESDRELALKLENSNLPEPAIEAWERYLDRASLSAVEAGKIRYRMAKLEQQAGRYSAAIGQFYRAEQMLGEEAGDLSRQITMHVRDCMQRLGQYSDLTRAMADRVDMSAGGASTGDGQVVAEIGGEKITVAGADRLITEYIEQLASMQPGLSPEQVDAFKRSVHAQLADPQPKFAQLQQIITSRVLANEARRSGLDESPEFRSQLTSLADRLLASRLIVEEVGERATVTPEDVRRFYDADPDRYSRPADATIAHILCDTEDQALDVIALSQSGASFDDLAKKYSKDDATKDSGGVLAQPVRSDSDHIPSVGVNAALKAIILSSSPDTVLDKPYKSDNGWHVIKVVARTEGESTTFEEVRDLVERDAREARRAEVTAQYLRELQEQAGVKFYPAALTASGDGGQAGDE